MDQRTIINSAKELTKARLLASDKQGVNDLRTSYAEALFLAMYERAVVGGDMALRGNSLSLIFMDQQGRTIRVICRDIFPFHIQEAVLDADIYVFAKIGKLATNCVILGWLSKSEVTECQTDYVSSRKGEALRHWYLVEPEYLVKMPKVFSFQDECQHDNWWGIWDYELEAWECCGCNRYLVDRSEREKAIVQSKRLDQIPKDEKGPERPVPEPRSRSKSELRWQGGVHGAVSLL